MGADSGNRPEKKAPMPDIRHVAVPHAAAPLAQSPRICHPLRVKPFTVIGLAEIMVNGAGFWG
jgi:hypothetical protein